MKVAMLKRQRKYGTVNIVVNFSEHIYIYLNYKTIQYYYYFTWFWKNVYYRKHTSCCENSTGIPVQKEYYTRSNI